MHKLPTYIGQRAGAGGGGWEEVRRWVACWLDLAMEAWRERKSSKYSHWTQKHTPAKPTLSIATTDAPRRNMPRSAALTAGVHEAGSMLTRLGLALERLSDTQAAIALDRVHAALNHEIDMLNDSAAASMTLLTLPADVLQELLLRVDPVGLSRMALASADLAAHVRTLMHSTDWGLRTNFVCQQQETEDRRTWERRYECEVQLLIAVTIRLSPAGFATCIARIGEQMADVPPPYTFWRAVGRAASQGLARAQWASVNLDVDDHDIREGGASKWTEWPRGEDDEDTNSFITFLWACLLPYLSDEDDAVLQQHAHPPTDDEEAIEAEAHRVSLIRPRADPHMCCLCTSACHGSTYCRGPQLTWRHEDLQEIAYNLVEVSTPMINRGLLTRAELLLGVGWNMPVKLRAFFLGSYLVGAGEGPGDESDWARWGELVADIGLGLNEFLELMRSLANFDANHYDGYDWAGNDIGLGRADYGTFSASDAFLSMTFSEYMDEMGRPRCCRNACVLLDTWAETTDFPASWSKKERRQMSRFLHEEPWKLHEVMPRGYCPWMSDLPSPHKPPSLKPAATRRRSSRGRDRRVRGSEHNGTPLVNHGTVDEDAEFETPNAESHVESANPSPATDNNPSSPLLPSRSRSRSP